MKRLVNSPLKVLGLFNILLGLSAAILTYGYLLVLGLIIIGVGLVLYFIDYGVQTFVKSRRGFWVAQFIIIGIFFLAGFVSYMNLQKHNYILFPKDFKGQAGIIFGIEGYPELPRTKFWKKTITMPSDGIIITSTKMEDIPSIVRYAYTDHSELTHDDVTWNPNFEMDCIVSDSRIVGWIFQLEGDSSVVKDRMTTLCNQIASNKSASAYKSQNTVISTDNRGKYLWLQDKGLTSLPDGLERLDIYKVILTGNNFYQVPEQVFQLKSLEDLTMAVNPISEFPCKISQLRQLKSLSFAASNIKQINWDLSTMDSLEHIDMARNGLTVFPERIKSIPNLTWLSLNDNQLTSFSFIDDRLKNLETLDLYSNKVKRISIETKFLKNLLELNLFDNEIDSIPDNIADLRNLEKLEIWNNPIKYISPNISKLTKLKSIRIDDDYLSQADKDSLKKWLPNCKINFQKRREK